MNAIFTTKIKSVNDAEIFFFNLWQLGLDYHPEDNAHDVINGKTKKPLFTKDEADLMNQRMEESFIYMDDPCEYLLDLMYKTDRE